MIVVDESISAPSNGGTRHPAELLTLFPAEGPLPGATARVYFALGANGQLKIGLTRRPNGHRGGEMHFVELCSVPGDRIVENSYHAKYARERFGRSEWFRLSNRLLMDVLTMCVGQRRVQAQEILKAVLYERLHEKDAA